MTTIAHAKDICALEFRSSTQRMCNDHAIDDKIEKSFCEWLASINLGCIGWRYQQPKHPQRRQCSKINHANFTHHGVQRYGIELLLPV